MMATTAMVMMVSDADDGNHDDDHHHHRDHDDEVNDDDGQNPSAICTLPPWLFGVLNRLLKHSSGPLLPTAAATSFSSSGSPPAPSCTVMSCR
jgi:hypothetical protein